MKRVRFGSTRLLVSPLGLGLAALGRPGYINVGHGLDLEGRRRPEELANHAAAMLDAAYAAGVRYFDAARSYGRAEEFVARWLAAADPPVSDAVIGSKWGYTYTADWQTDAAVHEVKEHSAAALKRQLAATKGVLGPALSLYQIHSATLETGVLDDAHVLDGLADLRDSGVAVGLSTSGPGQAQTIRKAIEVTRRGTPLFASVQATWNLFETSAESALEAASTAGLAVIVKEAVANGRLTARNRSLPPALLRSEASPDAIALAAALDRSWVTVVLSGAATLAQLESNLAALDVDPTLLGELPDLSEEPEAYWTTRASLAWT